MKHLPVITADRASCSCGKWHGLYRLAGAVLAQYRETVGPIERETAGQFTARAYREHEKHASAGPAARHEGQRSLLNQGDLF